MPRQRRAGQAGKNGHAPEAVLSIPTVIYPTAVYTPAQVEELLGLKKDSLRAAKHQGLVCVRRWGRDWYLGEDLLNWLRAGRCCAAISSATTILPVAQNGQKTAREG